MKYFLPLAGFILLTGCTTVEFVRRDLTPRKQAILRYLPQSDPEREAEYREKLNRKARDFCGGDFQIEKEYEARDDDGSGVRTGIGTGFGVGRGAIFIGGANRTSTMYHFVEIACQAKPAP